MAEVRGTPLFNGHIEEYYLIKKTEMHLKKICSPSPGQVWLEGLPIP